MRNRLLGLLVSTSLLAAGAAFAADAAKVTGPAPATPAAGAITTTTTTATTVEKSGLAAMTHTGVVKSFDKANHLLTLKDGAQFMLDPSLKGEDLHADKAVSLSFKTEGEKKIVTEYKIENKS